MLGRCSSVSALLFPREHCGGEGCLGPSPAPPRAHFMRRMNVWLHVIWGLMTKDNEGETSWS